MSLAVWSHIPSRRGLVPGWRGSGPMGRSGLRGGGMALSACEQTNMSKNITFLAKRDVSNTFLVTQDPFTRKESINFFYPLWPLSINNRLNVLERHLEDVPRNFVGNKNLW